MNRLEEAQEKIREEKEKREKIEREEEIKTKIIKEQMEELIKVKIEDALAKEKEERKNDIEGLKEEEKITRDQMKIDIEGSMATKIQNEKT